MRDATFADAPPASWSGLRPALGWAGVGLGAVGIGMGAAFTVSASTIAGNASSAQSQADVADRNRRIANFNTGAVLGYAVGGASLATGVLLLLWPGAQHVQVAASPSGGTIGYETAF